VVFSSGVSTYGVETVGLSREAVSQIPLEVEKPYYSNKLFTCVKGGEYWVNDECDFGETVPESKMTRDGRYHSQFCTFGHNGTRLCVSNYTQKFGVRRMTGIRNFPDDPGEAEARRRDGMLRANQESFIRNNSDFLDELAALFAPLLSEYLGI